MEEEKPAFEHHRPFNYHYSFTFTKNVRTWQEFVNTFRSIPFQQSLNHASNEEIEVFWQKHLEELSVETEKICILVPVDLNKNQANDGNVSAKGNDDNVKPKEPKGNKNQNKSQLKGKKTTQAKRIPINQKIIEIAKKMVASSFPQLDFDYESLFLGNQKQLLIFRKCYAIDSYIEKYRLPSTFKEPLSKFEHLTGQYYYLKIERNRAISTFKVKLIERLQNKIKLLNTELNKEKISFSLQWKAILQDFKSKKRCRDLILNNVNAQLINLLRPLCHECDTEVIDRFSECQLDQYKDILIVKKGDIRLQPVDSQIYQEEPLIVRYEYIQPQKKPQPPMDIKNLDFLGIDLIKNCYQYKFQLRTAHEWNKNQGIFIRSEQGEDNYQLNIDLPQKCTSIVIDIYPYKYGKISYEIYIWNTSGFTKSTEKIVLFNEFQPFNEKSNAWKNHQIYLLGQSQCGLKYTNNSENIQNEMILFPFQAKQLSMSNGAVICDKFGDVASWGQMYYPQQEPEIQGDKKQQEIDSNNFRIQGPSLIMSKKYIRRVSCGTGYCLMLSIFGSIYSMGYNQYGQLGLGNFNNGFANIQPQQICKFTNENSPFIVDIKASVSGASFAVNSKGQLYRWGFNQVNQTDFPIYDRFGSIINYTSIPIIYKWCDPNKLSKIYIQDPIKQIQTGNGFYLALSQSGILYGWGICLYLGINDLSDINQKVVIDIVNPIVTMKNIDYISVGYEHCIAITKGKRVLAWGKSSNFSKEQGIILKSPVDITAQIEDLANIKMIKAAKNFTVILTKSNCIKIMGKAHKLKERQFVFNFDIGNVVCSDEQLLGILEN